MDGPRARRAVPIIGAALLVILVAALVYLRPAPTATLTQSAHQHVTPWTLDPAYQVAYDFVTPAAGWAALARTDAGRVTYWIFMTSDGTTHWRLQSSGSTDRPEASVDLRFFDLNHGYAVIGREVALSTLDGGGHWERIRFPVLMDRELTFSDPRHAWFMSSEGFYSTADGGSTWRRLPPPPGGGVVFRDDSEGWAAIGATVFSTRDGGMTWTAHRLPQQNVDATQVRLLPGRGVMATTGLLAFTSYDGGATWRSVTAPPGAKFLDMAFEDATHWWAMHSGSLFKTTDGGQTWTPVSLQFDDWQYRVQVVDGRHAWARLDTPSWYQSRPGGTALAFTSDGGVDWDYADVPRPAL